MRRLSINEPATKEDFERIYAELGSVAEVVSHATKKDPEFLAALDRLCELESWVSLALEIEQFRKFGFRLVEEK